MAEVTISGPAGRLEGKYHRSFKKDAPVALILHPHPLSGGTMNNKVTYLMYQTFAQMGFNTLRFNFRGIGKSEGVFDNGEGELSDAMAVLDWLQVENKGAHSFWISGFSFGAWIGLQLLMRRPELEGFVMAGLPTELYDFSFLSPCPVSGKIIQGTADELANIDALTKLVNRLSDQKNIKVDFQKIEGADHFFTGHLKELSLGISNYMENRLKSY